ncbi:MAG: cation:proton antiporter [Hyphomicrobiaceae bacterium]|nr:cation:proton antiporter [Hyphomicrobiaceae bacterium]
MPHVTLFEIAVLLAALAIGPPLAKFLRLGSVLGYLGAGVLVGPYGVQRMFSVSEAKELLHLAEFGIVLLLFLIGLELRPKRLWSMRSSIFGLGGAQVGFTALLIAMPVMAFGMAWQAAIFIGLVLALSSTAFALQVLDETGELSQRHGRLGFSVLLFQDLVAIPLIALAPLFAVAAAGAAATMDVRAAALGLAMIAAVVVVGRFVIDPALRLIARAKVQDSMTAFALLVVVVVTILMQAAGLSASLGAFLAGALLAESSYRHQLEADLKPFEGLLLGLFFTAVGMSLNLQLLVEQPVFIAALVVGLVALKAAVLYWLGVVREGLPRTSARRLGLALSQGGEFAFLLLTVGVTAAVLSRTIAELLSVVVTLSMVATPILLGADKWLTLRFAAAGPLTAFDQPPERDGHVIIAGFGRVGGIVGRVLRAKKIPFTALDISVEQVEVVKRFGAEAFFGDASRPDILEAAQASKARAIVVAIDDVEASMRTITMVKDRYPNLPIYARARDRAHAHRLIEAGVAEVHRETFNTALTMTTRVLQGLALPEREVKAAITTFKIHDEKRLLEDAKFASDIERMQEKARTDAARLEKLFAEDAAEAAVAEGKASPVPKRSALKADAQMPEKIAS